MSGRALTTMRRRLREVIGLSPRTRGAGARAVAHTKHRQPTSQKGYLLIGLVTMMSIMGVMSGIAVQEWTTIERREREANLIFIQEQYASGIIEFEKDQGRLPTTLDELMNAGQRQQRFMRQPYTDPLTRGSTLEDWCLIKVGAAARVFSTCTESDPGNTGLGSGSNFQVGQQQSIPNSNSSLNNNAAGTNAIVGVHSKSPAQAFNTLKRGNEPTYNRWLYTIDEYRREVRTVPGLDMGQGPGVGGPGGNNGFGGNTGGPGNVNNPPGGGN